jgi:hypothetical protein
LSRCGARRIERPVRLNDHRPRARGTVSPSVSGNVIDRVRRYLRRVDQDISAMLCASSGGKWRSSSNPPLSADAPRTASRMSVQRRLAATPAISICVANLAIDSSGVRSDIVRCLRGCRILPPRPIIELISNVTPHQKRAPRPYFGMICGIEKRHRQKTDLAALLKMRRFERRLQTSLL